MSSHVDLVSLFSGCGGLDRGFEDAGFATVYANEYSDKIAATYQRNFPGVDLSVRSIHDVKSADLPGGEIGLIGSPPCQAWSEAGKGRGFNDPRGKVFWEYVRLIETRRPVFFVAENVPGMLHASKRAAFDNLMAGLTGAGYRVSYKLLDAADFGVPQNRERVFVVGLRSDSFSDPFEFPHPTHSDSHMTLRDAIADLGEPVAIQRKASEVPGERVPPNHEYMLGGWSSHFMARQRVRSWDEPSFTIQASARHAPLHPQASKMIRAGVDLFEFDPATPAPYRRFSVRECARVQTFPDDFEFVYDQVELGYLMVGNAVPVKMAAMIASRIRGVL